MATIKQEYVTNGNLIVSLENKYNSNTVKVTIASTGEKVDAIELGENFIEIKELEKGLKLIIEYELFGSLSNIDEEYELRIKINKLEKEIKELYKIIELHQEALNNRLNVTSFRAWTKLIEKKLGITLVDGNLNHLTKELSK